MDSQERARSGLGQDVQRKGAVLGILVAATVLVNLPLYLPLWPELGDWLYPGFFLALGLMATVPFLLVRMVPRVASFDRQWLPHAWSQWLWFVGMVVLLFVCGVISKPLANMVPLKYTPPLLRDRVSHQIARLPPSFYLESSSFSLARLRKRFSGAATYLNSCGNSLTRVLHSWFSLSFSPSHIFLSLFLFLEDIRLQLRLFCTAWFWACGG